jgi:hypothetical protein
MKIDIENPLEIVRNEVGIFKRIITSIMPKALVKKMVEETVKKEILKTLDSSIIKQFNKRGIQAAIDIK